MLWSERVSQMLQDMHEGRGLDKGQGWFVTASLERSARCSSLKDDDPSLPLLQVRGLPFVPHFNSRFFFYQLTREGWHKDCCAKTKGFCFSRAWSGVTCSAGSLYCPRGRTLDRGTITWLPHFLHTGLFITVSLTSKSKISYWDLSDNTSYEEHARKEFNVKTDFILKEPEVPFFVIVCNHSITLIIY